MLVWFWRHRPGRVPFVSALLAGGSERTSSCLRLFSCNDSPRNGRPFSPVLHTFHTLDHPSLSDTPVRATRLSALAHWRRAPPPTSSGKSARGPGRSTGGLFLTTQRRPGSHPTAAYGSAARLCCSGVAANHGGPVRFAAREFA